MEQAGRELRQEVVRAPDRELHQGADPADIAHRREVVPEEPVLLQEEAPAVLVFRNEIITDPVEARVRAQAPEFRLVI